MKLLYRAVPLLALMLIAAGCEGDSTGPDTGSIADYIVSVQTAAGVAAILNNAAPPAAGTGGGVTVTLLSEAILGGTTQARVNATEEFQRLIVVVEGVPGYFEVNLPGPTSSATLLITFTQDPPRDDFMTLFASGQVGSAFGVYQRLPVELEPVGTGDLQISVSWDALSDVDLHVVEPGGEEIYFGNLTSDNGGALDLDSNAGCTIDGVNVENVTYEESDPPTGTYTVRLVYWGSCRVPATNYVVTINRSGRPPQVFTGTFTGSGDRGSRGDGRTIATFTY